ncbi:scavenger receptor cysteine-rich type 1 protein M130-like [Tachysurus ichikawai]
MASPPPGAAIWRLPLLGQRYGVSPSGGSDMASPPLGAAIWRLPLLGAAIWWRLPLLGAAIWRLPLWGQRYGVSPFGGSDMASPPLGAAIWRLAPLGQRYGVSLSGGSDMASPPMGAAIWLLPILGQRYGVSPFWGSDMASPPLGAAPALSPRNVLRCVPDINTSDEDVVLAVGEQVETFTCFNSHTKTLHVSLSGRHGNTLYMVYASTESLCCFECGDMGHKCFTCPHKEPHKQGPPAHTGTDTEQERTVVVSDPVNVQTTELQ